MLADNGVAKTWMDSTIALFETTASALDLAQVSLAPPILRVYPHRASDERTELEAESKAEAISLNVKE